MYSEHCGDRLYKISAQGDFQAEVDDLFQAALGGVQSDINTTETGNQRNVNTTESAATGVDNQAPGQNNTASIPPTCSATQRSVKATGKRPSRPALAAPQRKKQDVCPATNKNNTTRFSPSRQGNQAPLSFSHAQVSNRFAVLQDLPVNDTSTSVCGHRKSGSFRPFSA